MSGPALVAVLLGAAFLASARRFGRFRQALGLTHLVVTGHAFLLIGALVGLAVTDVQLDAMAPVLTPIAALVAGTIGYSVGMRFHGRVLRAIPAGATRVALTPALGVALGTLALATVALAASGVTPASALAGGLVTAGAAAVSAPTLAAAIRRRRGGRSPDLLASLRLVELSAGLSNLLALTGAVFAFALTRAEGAGAATLFWVLCDVGLGLAAGLVTWLFLGGPARRDERLLLGVGMVAFTGGLAEWFGLSPAALCAVAGATLVNLPGDRMADMAQAIRRLERPALVMLMTLTGVYAVQDLGPAVLVLVALLTLGRAGALIVLARSVRGSLPPSSGLAAGPDWGKGLVAQGSLGLVCALAFRQVWPGHASGWALAAIAVASLINEIAAPPVLVRTLTARATAHPAS
ncbi:MAG: hypothetical protein H6744_10390 [Deltaproteobacteria bacterium]|nr:hypothetical protein [Deltaproteobacteria bacterium]